MTQKVREIKRPAQELENSREINACHHHWVIEAAQGHTSRGVCKICGTMREFLNAMPEYSSFLETHGVKGSPNGKERDENERN